MNFYQILTFSAAVFLLMNRISKSEGRQENPRQNERDKGRCRSGEVHVQPQGSSKYLLIGQVLLESHQWEGSLVSKVMLNIDKFRNVSRSFHEWLGNGSSKIFCLNLNLSLVYLFWPWTAASPVFTQATFAISEGVPFPGAERRDLRAAGREQPEWGLGAPAAGVPRALLQECSLTLISTLTFFFLCYGQKFVLFFPP